jgi:hypothetical protein
MIEILPESEGKILAIKASEKLTDEDYKETFIPRMDQLITEFGRIRVLFTMGDNFKGWEAAALWDDAHFGATHREQFEKMAIVGGPKWVEWGVKLAGHLMPGAVKTFPLDQAQAAHEWIKE